MEDIHLAMDQSARTNPSLFTTRCSLTDAQTPFEVIRVLSVRRSLPVFRNKRTTQEPVGMSQRGQTLTSLTLLTRA
jgi:hypothetical protein